MAILFPDTTPEAEQVLIALLRCAPVARKLEMLGEMNVAARQLALQGLRARNPAASEEQLQRYLADLLPGPELAVRAYGQQPAAVGSVTGVYSSVSATPASTVSRTAETEAADCRARRTTLAESTIPDAIMFV